MPLYDVVLATSTFFYVLLCAIYLYSSRASIFHPATVYLAFHGLVFVVRPIFARIYDFRSIYTAVGFEPSLAEKIDTVLAANVGLVVFVGVCMVLCPRLEFKQDPLESASRGAMFIRFMPAFIVLTGLCLWSLVWLWMFQQSGESIGVTDLDTGTQGLVGVSGYFISLTGFMVALGAIFAYLNRFRWWSFIPIVVFSVLRLGIGGRGQFVAALFVLAVVFLYDRRRVWPKAWMAAAIIPVYFIFSAVVSDRGAAIREALSGEAQPEIIYYQEADLKPLEHMDFGNLEFFEYIVHVVPERAGTYDYFLHNLQLFTEPIPRGLWKDKPFGAPIRPVELYRYGKPIGMTMSVPGVGWYSLGYIGVIIWSAVFALIYSAAYRAFALGRQTVLATLGYALFLGTGIVAFRDGLIMTILKQMLFFSIPLIVLWVTEQLLSPVRNQRLEIATDPAQAGAGVSRSDVSTPAQRRAALARRARPLPE